MIDIENFKPVIGQNPPDGEPMYWVRTAKEPFLTISFWPCLKHVLEDNSVIIGNEFRLHKENAKTKRDIVYAGLLGIQEGDDPNNSRARLIALRPTTTERKIKPYVDTILNMYRYMVADITQQKLKAEENQ